MQQILNIFYQIFVRIKPGYGNSFMRLACTPWLFIQALLARAPASLKIASSKVFNERINFGQQNKENDNASQRLRHHPTQLPTIPRR